MNSIDEARAALRLGGNIADMAEAIAMIVADPSSLEADIRLGLRHPGFIAEQAEFALGRRCSSQRSAVSTDGHLNPEP